MVNQVHWKKKKILLDIDEQSKTDCSKSSQAKQANTKLEVETKPVTVSQSVHGSAIHCSRSDVSDHGNSDSSKKVGNAFEKIVSNLAETKERELNSAKKKRKIVDCACIRYDFFLLRTEPFA
jgi:hypothetical protein